MFKRNKVLLLLAITLVSACTKKKTDDPNANNPSNVSQNPSCPSIDQEIRFSGSNLVMTNTSIYGGSVPNYNNYGYGVLSMSTSQSFTNGVKLTNSNNTAGNLTLEVASGTGSNQYGYSNGYNNGGTYNNGQGNTSFQYVNFSGSLTLSHQFRSHIRTFLQRQQYNNSGYNNYNGGYGSGYNNGYYGNNNYNNGYNGQNNGGYPVQNPTDYYSACVSGVAINLGYSRDVNTGQPREIRNGQLVLYLNNSSTLYYTIPF